MSVESLMETLASLRGAVIAYRSAVDRALDTEKSDDYCLLQAAENRLAQELRVTDHVLRPQPAAGHTPRTNMLPAGHWSTVARLDIVEQYEIELELEDSAAADEGEARDKLEWQTMGMSPENVRSEYLKVKVNNVKLSTFVQVVNLGEPEFRPDEPEGEDG